MPPDPLPPLAPFPALTPPAAVAEPPAAPSLLSNDQRADFAFAADLLGGAGELEFQPPPPATPASGSFLLTPDDATPAAPASPVPDVPAMPAVNPQDLLSDETQPEPGVLSAEDGLSLQNLGAALAEEIPAAAPTEETPAASPAPAADFEPGDLGPIDLPPAAAVAPIISTAPVPEPEPVMPDLLTLPDIAAALEAAPPVIIPSTEPPKPITAPQEIAAVAPVIPDAKSPGFSLLDLAAPAVEKAPPIVEEQEPAAQEKPENKPALIIFPSPGKDPAPPATNEAPILFPPARSVPVEEPEDLEEEVEFDAPLLFPVPSALPDSERASHHAAAVAQPAESDGGLGAMLAGALLIGIGIVLVSRVPSLATAADAATTSITASAALLRGEMFLSAAGGAFCLLMGIGAATLRRWAPPIIHAAGWVVLLTALLGLGVGTAALFHFAGNETSGDASPPDGTAMFAGVGIVGVALPLLLIAIFQRPALARLCAVADKRERWTDRRSIPALMVVLTGLLLGTAAITMTLARARFPLVADWEVKHAAFFWSAAGAAALAGGLLTACGKRLGWWLLLLLVLALGGALYSTTAGNDWHAILPGGAPQPGTTAAALLAASTMLPSLLILLMTRKSLTPPEHE